MRAQSRLKFETNAENFDSCNDNFSQHSTHISNGKVVDLFKIIDQVNSKMDFFGPEFTDI